MIQSQARRDVGSHVSSQPLAELILDVGGHRIIFGHTASHTHRSLQVVMTPLQSTTQTVAVRQREDALQMGHDATLVALQLFIIREVGIIGREITTRIITVSQGDGRKVVIVSMTVPVHVERHLVCLVQFPDSTSSCALVTILHVVSLHIDSGVFAAGAIDTLPIGAALEIEFQILQRLVGQTL